MGCSPTNSTWDCRNAQASRCDSTALLAALSRYEPAEIDESWLLIRRGLGFTDEQLVEGLGQHGISGAELARALKEILGQSACPPTDALLAAVIARTPENTEYAMTEYGRSRYGRPTNEGTRAPVPAKTRWLPQPMVRKPPSRHRLPKGKPLVLGIGLMAIIAMIIITFLVLAHL